MKKFIALFLMFFLITAVSFAADRFFIKEKHIKKAKSQVFGIVITYQFDDVGYQEYLVLREKHRGRWGGYLLQEDIVKKVGEHTYVSSMATATVIRYEQLITVWHLFSSVSFAQSYWLYAYNGEIVERVSLVALGNQKDDYAVLKFNSPQGFKGLKIAKKDLRVGEKAMWIGNGDCIAFNERYDYVGDLTHYFDIRRSLELVHWIEAPFISMSPVARGDSGTALLNKDGKIVGIIYLGFFTDTLAIGASQSLTKLREFLDSNRIKY